MEFSKIHELFESPFLTRVAENIGDNWRSFLIELGLSSTEIHHLEHDNPLLLDLIRAGVRKWAKKPIKETENNVNQELFQWITTSLSTIKCMDILDEISPFKTDIDKNQLFEKLSLKLTMERRIKFLDQLGIRYEEVEAAQRSNQILKEKTLGLLEKWYNDNLLKILKFKKIAYTLRSTEYTQLACDLEMIYLGISESEKSDAEPTVEETKFQNNTQVSKKRSNDKRLEEETGPSKKAKTENLQEHLVEEQDTNEYPVTESENAAITETEKAPTRLQLRKYQKELANPALTGENVLICVVPNAGKTIVAFHVIEEHFKRNPNGKVVFMARTNPLLNQQYDKAQAYFNGLKDSQDIVKFSVGQDTTEETIKTLFETRPILFMTPQSLANRLYEDQKYPINIGSFTLLVFDECHHAHGRTPYNEIMSYYRRAKYKEEKQQLPQILGLTASPGTDKASNEEAAISHLLKLMEILDTIHLSTVRENKEELESYASVSDRKMIPVAQRKTDPIKDKLHQALQYIEPKLKSQKVDEFLSSNRPDTDKLRGMLQSPPIDKLAQKYMQWISETKLEVEKFLMRDEEVPRILLACLRHLEIYATCLEINGLLDIEAVEAEINRGLEQEIGEHQAGKTYEEMELDEQLQKIKTFISSIDVKSIERNPNVNKIIDKLETTYAQQGQRSRLMIFVSTRALAKDLAERISHLKHLNAEYFTGSQASDESGGRTKVEQEDILKKFRSGVHKCLIATAVASEGIDIPECNLIIKYRFTANEITSLQMKGRIRQSGGTEVIVGSEKENLREMVNLDRMDLMNQAVESVVNMNVNELRNVITEGERILFANEEAKRQQAEKNKKSKTKEVFQVICRKCPKTICGGHNLRILKEQHHFVVDKSIFNNITRKEMKEVPLEDVKITKRAIGTCGHEWGHVFMYSECEFVCLSQKFIKIFNVEKKTTLNIKKWKDLPYHIGDLTEDDLQEYRTQEN